MEVRWPDWLSSGEAVRALSPSSEHGRLEDALLDRLSSGALRAICTSSVHTYGSTTFSSSRVAAIPPEEWQYLTRGSSLDTGEVQMEWTSKVSLPILGLCPVVAHYSGVHLCLEDLIREFQEASWPGGKAVPPARLPRSSVAPPVAKRSNNVIDLAAGGRVRPPDVSRRSAPWK